MLQYSRALLALLPLTIIAACGDTIEVTGTQGGTASVRFINATDANIDVSNAGSVATGDNNLGFGKNSSCLSVNTSGTAGTGLVFNQAGTTTAVPGFTQSFTTGGNYTVIAYPSSTGTQFITLSNAGFTPTSGQAGLRVFNAASTIGSVVVLSGGTALGTGTGVSYGNAGSFINVPAGAQTITFNTGTGTTTIANAGSLTFTAGQTYTLVVAPAASGTNTLRTFLIPSC
jgi:Domain of unknown function (DUF4397)